MSIKLRAAALSCAALLVTGCGGSSEDIYVSVSYASPFASLYTVSVIDPTLTGFDGHDQRCDQSSGALPIGMHINNDCSITGRPVEAGTFSFGFTIRAEDVSGSIDSTASVGVIAPTTDYTSRNTAVTVGMAVSDAPRLGTSGWVAPTDGTALNWSYAVTGGSLAPGLTLDAGTGVVSGAPTSAGNYSATIQGTLTTVYGSYTPTAGTYQLNVAAA